MKFINESIYWHGTGRTSSCLKRYVQYVLVCAAAIIMVICFCKAKISSLLEELPPQYCYIFCNRMKECIVNRFDSVNVTDMDH